MKQKGFTLIELLAVIVILAIIALIATPIVLKIVSDSKVSANKRSIDLYGKAVENAIADYQLKTGQSPTSFNDIKDYIDYSGKEVDCDTTINNNGTIFLSNCKIDNNIIDYIYGESASYKIGDIITYKNMDFYVIKDSSKKEDYVVLLKKDELTYDEINAYGTGYINKAFAGELTENGGVAYFSSDTCNGENTTGCTNSYNSSDVKHIVDSWSNGVLTQTDLKKDSLGYKVRLITKEELIENFGFEIETTPTSFAYFPTVAREWLSTNYYGGILTMSLAEDNNYMVYSIYYFSQLRHTLVYLSEGLVRPVINLKKSAI